MLWRCCWRLHPLQLGRLSRAALSQAAGAAWRTSTGCVVSAVHGTVMRSTRAKARLAVMKLTPSSSGSRLSSRLCSVSAPLVEKDTFSSPPALSAEDLMNFRSSEDTRGVSSNSIAVITSLLPSPCAAGRGGGCPRNTASPVQGDDEIFSRHCCA